MSSPNYNKPNKNERSTQSKFVQPSMRRFKRIQSGQRNNGHQTEVMQEIKAIVKFTFNRAGKRAIVNRRTGKPMDSITVPLSRYRLVNLLKDHSKEGLGKIETFAPKTIWHNAGVEV